MTSHFAPSVPASSPSGWGAVATGGWTLASARAVALRPHKASTLVVQQGQVWVTLTGPHAGHGNERGDVFLQTGETLYVPAGQRVVLESLGKPGDGPVCFDWAPAGAAPASLWQQSVAQPLSDLGQALRSAAGATGRLVVGSARFALHSIAHGVRV